MPTMTSGDFGSAFTIPTSQLGAITTSVQNQSVIAALCPETPTLYGNVQAVRMTRKPRAEIVAEAADKSSDTAEWGSVVATPTKVQTTVRFTDEVKWLDEDHRLLIVDQLVASLSESIARAVDLITIHGVNPISGTRATSITTFLDQTTKRVQAGDGATANPDAELTAAYAAVGAEGEFVANGIGLDHQYAFAVATQRDAQGNKINPDMGFGSAATSWNGITVARSNTISGVPEMADSGNRALVGDFSALRWGFQRRLPVQVIEYGDPDGGGDLQRNNQVAYRAEAVLYAAIFDLDAFAVVETEPPAAG